MAQRARRHRAAGRGLVPPPRRPRLVATDDASAAFFPPAHRPGRVVGPARRRRVRGDPRVEPRVPRSAAACSPSRPTPSGADRAADDRGDGDLPDGVLLPGAYTESLFLFLSVLTFRAARHDRWGRVAVFGALAALTRSAGILVPALLVEALAGRAGGARAGRARRRRGAIALGPLAWFAWWGVVHGDWLAPMDAQALWGAGCSSRGSRWARGGARVDVPLVLAPRSHDRGARDRGLALAFPALRGSERVYGSLSLLLPLLTRSRTDPCSRCRGSSWWCSRRCGGSPASAGGGGSRGRSSRPCSPQAGPSAHAVRELATSLLTDRRERSEGASGPG